VSVVRSLVSSLGRFIWSIAEQLRGPYRPNQYGNVILPLTILRRLDCILEPDRETVRALAATYDNPVRLKIEVRKATGRPFYNTSNYSFANLLADADGLADNLADYLDRFSPDVDVFEYFDFKKEILALEKAAARARRGSQLPEERSLPPSTWPWKGLELLRPRDSLVGRCWPVTRAGRAAERIDNCGLDRVDAARHTQDVQVAMADLECEQDVDPP
jgi:hypothetical protein